MALILMAGIAHGQNLQKGNIVGIHVMSITLQPGVTIEKYIDLYKSKFVPEFEKAFSGSKAYAVKSLRGENKDSYGFFVIFKTVADRDKYFKADGSYTETGQAAYDKTKPVMDELNKLK